MKRKTVLSAAALALCLLLSGCGNMTVNDNKPHLAEASELHEDLKNEEPKETDLPGNWPKFKGGFNENGWLKLISGGETILPFEHEIIGQKLSSYAGVVEEGLALSECDPYFLDLLPVIDRSKGFEMEVYEWGSIYLIDVFDTGFATRAHKINTAELYDYVKRHDEYLLIDIQIFIPGCEIFEEPTERTGKGYAFIISGSDKDASANQPFMGLFSDGVNVGAREFFFYGTSAYYEDGVPKGMLSADGEAFFDSDHIEKAYDTLPIYSGCRTEGLDIRLWPPAKIVQIFVYDPSNDFERMTLYTKAELDKLIIASAADGAEYVIEVIVSSQGDYIEELGESESCTNGYAFIVK